MQKTLNESLGMTDERSREISRIGAKIISIRFKDKESSKADIIRDIINRDDLVEVEKASLLFGLGEFVRDMENKIKVIDEVLGKGMI